MYTIDTHRLRLRLLTPETYQQVFSSLPESELKAFFGYKTDEEMDAERQRFEAGLTMFNKSFALFHLMEKKSGNVIGWCGYHTWYLPHFRAEIGYTINDDALKGKGFMKEALGPVLHYGFSELGLKRIEAFIGPDNVPSLKLIKSFGFTEEGCLRQHYFKNGVLEDSILFALLAQEYKKVHEIS